MPSQTWIRPEWLPLALLLLALLAFEARALRIRRAEVRRWVPDEPRGRPDAETTPAFPTWGPVRRLLRAIGVTLIAVALIGPSVHSRPAPPESGTSTLWVAFDLSRSMSAGTPVSRFETGRATVRELLATTPGARVGVAVFGEGAHVLLPPTRDPEVVRRLVDALEPGMLTFAGTDASAIEALGVLVGDSAEPGAAILLVSDGEWVGGNPSVEGLPPVHAIWTDRPLRSPVPGLTAAKAETRARPDALRRLTEATGGVFVRVSDSGDFSKLRRTVSEAVTVAVRGPAERIPVDATPGIALVAALLLLATHPSRRLDR